MPQASASASSHLLSRRRVALAIPLLGSALWAATAKASTPVLRTQRPVVGTAVDIVVEGADAQQLRSATEHAFARMRELEALLSKYDPQSPVSRVSTAAGKHPVAVPPADERVAPAGASIRTPEPERPPAWPRCPARPSGR